jgi:hypothetical protein
VSSARARRDTNPQAGSVASADSPRAGVAETRSVRKLLICLVAGVALAVIPAAAASPTVRLTLIHVMRGCHMWANADSRPFGAKHTLLLKHGSKIEVRVSCPMAFDVTQVAGPKLRSGLGRWETGTTHTLVFTKVGVYRFKAVNVQTSDEMNLETLGLDATPLLTVRVR